MNAGEHDHDAAPLRNGVRTVFFDAGNTLLYLDLAWIVERLSADGWDITEDRLFYGQSVASFEATRLALLKKYPTDSDRHVPYFARLLELAGIPKAFAGDCVKQILAEHRRRNLWRYVPEYIAPTLRELNNRGYMLGVISNSDGRIRSLLDEHDLASYFTCIIDSAVIGAEKPGGEIFRHALDAAETDAEKCVYVGDIYAVDVVGAEAAGIAGVLIDPLSLHEQFDCVKIKRLGDLVRLLPPIEHPPRQH
jgi:putative hydrolase of the HAD superfamily